MRIISQDGTIDVPYEHVVIQQYKGKIYFLNKNLTGVESIDDIEIASYSTEEKAKKAIDMLHNDYYEHEIERIYHEGNQYIHPTFQFPKDADVEV